MTDEVKPSAENVEEVLLRQNDPANWTPEMWDAHEQDMAEIRQAVELKPNDQNVKQWLLTDEEKASVLAAERNAAAKTAQVELVEFPQSEEVKAAVAAALAKIAEESFSGRNKQFGKMINCQVCGDRHRTINVTPREHYGTDGKVSVTLESSKACVQQFKYLYTLEEEATNEDGEPTGEEPKIEDFYATCIPAEGAKTIKQLIGATSTKAKRKHPPINAYQNEFVRVARLLQGGDDIDESTEEGKEAVKRLRILTRRQITKAIRKARKARMRRTDVSRRINRGLVNPGRR